MYIIHLDEVDSTNTYLKLKANFVEDFTCVYADFQTKGHGRFNRTWESEKKKNLLCSVILKDNSTIKNYTFLSLITGVVIFKLLQELKIENIKIKWPNDIYVNDKKIAGIILESSSNENSINNIVIGVGLNINQKEFINKDATSISLLTKKDYIVEKILHRYLHLLNKEIRLLNHKKSKFIEIINNNNYLLHREMYAVINNKKEKVIVDKINPDGSINVIFNDNCLSLVSNELTFN